MRLQGTSLYMLGLVVWVCVSLTTAARSFAQDQKKAEPQPPAAAKPSTETPPAKEAAPAGEVAPAKETPPAEAAAKPETQTKAAERKPFDLRTNKTLTGDWGGVRTSLEDKGFKVNLKLMNQLMVNMHGGLETKNGHDTGGTYDLDFLFDFEKMGLLKGASFFFRTKGTWGGDDSDFDREKIGGLSRTNTDAGTEEPIFVDKWWWKQFLWEKKVELRLGKIETYKDLTDSSTIMGDEDLYFLNSFLVVNPTIPNGKGLGIYAKWNITPEFYVQLHTADAQNKPRQTGLDTPFHDEAWFRAYAEVGFDPKLDMAKGKLPGHWRTGTWFDPTVKQRNFNTLGGSLAPRYEGDDWGWYAGFDQMLWKENQDEKDKQGLSVAGRYGWADGDVNRYDGFWAAAVAYTGLVPTRDRDMMGLGVAQAIVADEYHEVRARGDRETVYELYYSFEATPWLIISPTFQFIHQTGGDESDPDTFVGGLRFKMAI